MTDIGGGVHEDPWDDLGGHEPNQAPTPAARGIVPSCPVCGEHGMASRIGHPDGTYFCSCGSLFNGTDAEWRRWARHRREHAERLKRPALRSPKVPTVRLTIPEMVELAANMPAYHATTEV